MKIFNVTFEGHVYNHKGVFAYSVERTLNCVAKSDDILDIQAAVERQLDNSFGSFYLHAIKPVSNEIKKFHYAAQPYDVAELVNVTWHPYADDDQYNSRGVNGYIVGTVVKGSTTSRLFHATSTKQWPTNVEKRLDYIPFDQIRFDADGNAQYVSATCG